MTTPHALSLLMLFIIYYCHSEGESKKDIISSILYT